MPPGSKNTMEVELRGRIENLEKNLDEAKRDLKSFGDSAETESSRTKGALNKIADGFQKIFFVVEGAKRLANAVFGPIKKVTDLYAAQEAAVSELNSALKNQNAYTDQLSQQYQEVASNQQALTGIGDEATIKAAALTMRYAEMADVMMIIPGLQDFMASTGMKMDAASSLIGKSISSNINALSRYGIEIDTSASKQEKLEQLTEGLAKKFGGAAADRRDTLEGSIAAAEAALGDLGETIGSKFAKNIKQGSNEIERLANLAKQLIEIPISQRMEEERIEVRALVNQITSLNTKNDRRGKLLDKLQKMYPGFLEDLDAETVSNEDLAKQMEAVNKQLLNKIKLQLVAEDRDQVLQKEGQALLDLDAAENAVTKSIEILNEKYKDQLEAQGFVLDSTKSLEDQTYDTRVALGVFGKSSGRVKSESKQLGIALTELKDAQEEYTEATNKSQNAQETYDRILKRLNQDGGTAIDLKKKSTEAVDDHARALDGNIRGYRELNKEIALLEEQFLSSNWMDDVNQNFNATKNLVSGIGNAFASIVVYGEDFGDAVVGSLQQIAAQVASMAAVWAILMVISGGTGLITSPGGLGAFIGSELGFSAKGTRSWPGGKTVVGEDGPEIIDPPSGSRIFNNRETNNLFGQGGDMTETNALLGRMVTLLEQPKSLLGTVNIRRKDLEVMIEEIAERKYS